MDEETKALIEWIVATVPNLRASRRNWKITLNGGAGGEIKTEVLATGEIASSRVSLGGDEFTRVEYRR